MVLEVCCSSVDDALEAEAGGADRVELCSSLFFGSLISSTDSATGRVLALQRLPQLRSISTRFTGLPGFF